MIAFALHLLPVFPLVAFGAGFLLGGLVFAIIVSVLLGLDSRARRYRYALDDMFVPVRPLGPDVWDAERREN